MRKSLKTITTIGLLSLFTISFVSTAQDVTKCEGKMGDVKMSLLDPDQFKKQNGICWVSMEGLSIEGTPLAYTVSELNGKTPDARGQFFRVLDRTGKVDVDSKKNRPVGSPQEDKTGPHEHPIRISKQEKNSIEGKEPKWGYPDDSENSTNSSRWKRQYWRGAENGHTASLKTKETRPKNIAIYAYVHVGE